jgi:hypothetical protein
LPINPQFWTFLSPKKKKKISKNLVTVPELDLVLNPISIPIPERSSSNSIFTIQQ